LVLVPTAHPPHFRRTPTTMAGDDVDDMFAALARKLVGEEKAAC
jgi:hypothetical protein